MNILTYQKLVDIETGKTYENDVIELLKLDKNKSYNVLSDEIVNIFSKIEPAKLKKSYKINGKRYKYDKELLESSWEQLCQLEMMLAEDDNNHNIHKLLAIYLRPVDFLGRIAPFDMKSQEGIATEIQNHMKIEDATALLLFFCQVVMKYMKTINIRYLKLMREKPKS